MLRAQTCRGLQSERMSERARNPTGNQVIEGGQGSINRYVDLARRVPMERLVSGTAQAHH